MNINDTLQDFVQYIAEGFARIFSPAKDDYANIGVQPFDCEPITKLLIRLKHKQKFSSPYYLI